jgi:hypothetical protein
LIVREIEEVDGSVEIVLWSGEKITLPGGRRKDICEALTKNIVCVSVKKSPTMNFCTQEIAAVLGRYIYIPKVDNENYNLTKFYIFHQYIIRKDENMKAKEAWDKFKNSGKIEDYLNYKKESKGK